MRANGVDTSEVQERRETAEVRAQLDRHREDIRRQRDRWNTSEARWSWGRLFVFLAILATWIVWAATLWIPAALSVVGVVVFVATVKRHLHCQRERELREGMLTVLDESLRRCGGKVVTIRDGSRPADRGEDSPEFPPVLVCGPTDTLTDQERDDLDVFASPTGLFGLLNRTSCAFGARRLRDMLDRPCLSPERIVARQSAVQWLEQNTPERVRIMGAAVRLRAEDKRLAGFARAVDQAKPLTLFAPVSALRVSSVLTTLLATLAIGNILVGNFGWTWLLALVLAANAIVLRKIGPALGAALNPWRDVAWGAFAFLAAVRQAADDLPREMELSQLGARFEAVTRDGKLRSLCGRIGWTEYGGGWHAAANYIALYDVHVASAILKRAVPDRENLRLALSALAELEALESLACFAAEQPSTCYPTPAPVGEVSLRIREGRHPLIAPERVMPNDVSLTPESRMWIITGSNMAGKSTFLRMAGVNVLLAQIGSAVSAGDMTWSPARLVTDLQARDSLAEDESYFLAEVRHLRRMVLPADADVPMLGLIDEPFRGTNSQDQSAASVAVIEHLITTRNLFILATHDRHLTEMADGGAVSNYHFREDLGSDGLVFGYQLHDGPAQTRNALRVLEREGYPPRVLEGAHAWLARQGEDDPRR